MELSKLIINKPGDDQFVINDEVFSLRKGVKKDAVVASVKDFIKSSRLMWATVENRMDIEFHDLMHKSGLDIKTSGDARLLAAAISLVKTPTNSKLFAILPDWSLRRVGNMEATVGEFVGEEDKKVVEAETIAADKKEVKPEKKVAEAADKKEVKPEPKPEKKEVKSSSTSKKSGSKKK